MQSTNLSTNVRQPYLSGKQTIAGVWFPSDWFSADERAKRILASWRKGAVAIRFVQGDALRFNEAIEVDCDTLLGWPLQAHGSSLSSAQLKKEERAQLPGADYWIVTDARVSSLQEREGERLDVAAWLNVEHLTLHDTYDCSQVLPPPTVLQLESRPVREVLGNVPPASREQGEFLQALQKAQEKQKRSGASSATGSGSARSSSSFGFRSLNKVLAVIAIAVIVFALLLAYSFSTSNSNVFGFILAVGGSLYALSRINRLSDEGGASGQSKSSQAQSAQQAAANAIRNRAKDARPQKWREWLARTAMMTRLARLVGMAQARYMRRLMDYFDNGNLAEALRHAVPIDGKGQSLGQGFGTPGRREQLNLSETLANSISMGFGDDIQAMLRQLYRQAFAKLDREKRIDEAVFVLAELLNAKTEALDYLEKHERFAQAAELALGWDMSADVIVRLQYLAGDWRKAIAVARRDNAFANAVLQLEKKWPQPALRLRQEWGRALTEQGDWLRAVDAVWPVESLREQAAEWLTMAERSGGVLGARALVQRAYLLPDTIELYADYLTQVQNDPARWLDRRNLAMALLQMKREQASRDIAAIVTPGLLIDHTAGHRHLDRNALQHLINLTQDQLLQIDIPKSDWPTVNVASLATRTEPLAMHAPDAGIHPVMDVVPLDDERYLVALGEAGAILVDNTGAVITRFAIPADSIVLSHTNQVALVLARREALWRVSRLDLMNRAIVDLGLCEMDTFARAFDGVNWTVYRKRRLQVLDVTRSLNEVVWHIGDLPGQVFSILVTAHVEQVLIASTLKDMHLFFYRLPERRLASREVHSLAENEYFIPQKTGLYRTIKLDAEDDAHVWGVDDWVVSSIPDEQDNVIRWASLRAPKNTIASLNWPTYPFSIRHHAEKCLVFDNEGRLLVLDYVTGRSHSISIR